MQKSLKVYINGDVWHTGVESPKIGVGSAGPDADSVRQGGRRNAAQHIDWINQRQHERRKCRIEVEYSDGRRLYRDCMTDLSVGGAFVETASRFDLGQTIIITIQLNDNCVKRKGSVTRLTSGGIGISFSGGHMGPS